MDLKILGTTNILVSPLGLGTVKLGRSLGVKYPESFSIPTDREAKSLFALAADLGINLLDTAPAYGNSEERLGRLLKGQRSQWVICSKAGEDFSNATGESTYRFTPKYLRASVERSLRRLGTDFLDIVLIHSDGRDETIIRELGALDVINELKREGKIRAGGMSTKTVEGGLLAAQHSDCVMVTWNLDYDDELPVIDFCQRENKGVLIKKALASGHINTRQDEDVLSKSFEMIFGHPGVTSVIIGTINPQHLAENVEKANAAIRAISK